MANSKKPMDKGLKRNLLVLGGVAVVAAGVIGGIMVVSGDKSNAAPPPSTLGKVIPSGDGPVAEISPAARERLNRVQTSEATAAARAGRSYIPDTVLGQPEPIAPTQRVETAPPPAPTAGSYSQFQQNQQRTTGGGGNGEMAAIQDGLLRQMEAMVSTMGRPATVQPVSIADVAIRQPNGNAGQGGGGAPGRDVPQIELIGGDEILPAMITTPIDTYTTKFALAEIAGGRFNGAQLRGEVVPMGQSGDVEDVGIRFTSMRFNGKMYQIDAIALNESTANDAMSGDVDRRYMSRYVMPIVMAGLSGVSTYFTARGTPSTSVATGVGGGDAVVVDQERASREDAKNQGIGDAIDKGVQMGERAVNRNANRPNRVTLATFTPIGIIFNSPVYEQ